MRRTTVMPQSGCTPTMRFIMALLSSVPLFELRGLLERQLAWPCTLENPIDHQRGAPQHVAIVRTLGHQPTNVHEVSKLEHRCYAVRPARCAMRARRKKNIRSGKTKSAPTPSRVIL